MAKRIWLMGIIVFDFLDLLTTHVVIKAGLCEEANPFAAYLMNEFGLTAGVWIFGTAIKIVGIVFALFLWPYFENKTSKFSFHCFYGAVYLLLALRILVVFNHLLIITSG